MTLDELQAAADRAHEQGLELTMLVFPQPWKAPPRFPRRELACINSAGGAVCWVRADKLAALTIPQGDFPGANL